MSQCCCNVLLDWGGSLGAARGGQLGGENGVGGGDEPGDKGWLVNEDKGHFRRLRACSFKYSSI